MPPRKPHSLNAPALVLALSLAPLWGCGDDGGSGPGEGSTAQGGAGASGQAGQAGAAGQAGQSGQAGQAGQGGTTQSGEACKPAAASACASPGCSFDPGSIDCDAAVKKMLEVFCGDSSPCGKCSESATLAEQRDFLTKDCLAKRAQGGEDNAMWGCNAQSSTCAERNDCYAMACMK